MKFRPCIDLHQGRVKQIVGGSLTDSQLPTTNFETNRSAAWYAALYKQDGLTGGHVIQLGTGNQEAAATALETWPGGLQLGGGISDRNATDWIEKGASAVIVTSWVFHDGRVDFDRLKRLSSLIGRDKLVLDLSCRKKKEAYYVVTDRWQTFTQERVGPKLLDRLAKYCSEYLIHGVDVEGRVNGIETRLVSLLGRWKGLPITYAGGIRSHDDIQKIGELGGNRIDFTVGSALDIFGGTQLKYTDIARQYSPLT